MKHTSSPTTTAQHNPTPRARALSQGELAQTAGGGGRALANKDATK